MKTEWIKNIVIAVSVVAALSLALYLCSLPQRKFLLRRSVFCDTLKRRHGYHEVKIGERPRPMVVRGLAYTDWTITLHGLIETKENSRAIARCFADNVACYGHGFLDSVTITYADGPLVVRQYGFANSDLNE